MSVTRGHALMNSTAPSATADDDALGEVAEHGQAGRSRAARPRRRASCAAGPRTRASPPCSRPPSPARRPGPPAGCRTASGAASSMNSSRNSECSMPATGPRAPARTLVAVRAIVPVTQMPPNSAEADIGDALRDQLAVRAVAAAGHAVGDHGREQRLRSRPAARRRARPAARPASSRARRPAGAARATPTGMPPKRCRWSRPARPSAQVASADAARRRSACPASAAAASRRPTIRPIDSSASATATRIERVAAASASAASFGTIGPGSLPASVRPSRSLIWLAKMMTAMPAVKPTVTG